MRNSEMEVHFLHGFLGLPSDWFPIARSFSHSFCHSLTTTEEMKDRSHSTKETLFNPLFFSSFAKSFNEKILEQAKTNKAPSHRVLVGYSLGGRLALAILKENPTLWSHIILISSHTGLNSLQEREIRLQQDKKWSQRFLYDSWDELMQDWNQQEVFKSSSPFIRKESAFKREELARQLVDWSLGNQPDFSDILLSPPCPFLYLYGEKDTKFKKLAQSFPASTSLILRKEISGAGHRVIMDSPDQVSIILRSFLSS